MTSIRSPSSTAARPAAFLANSSASRAGVAGAGGPAGRAKWSAGSRATSHGATNTVSARATSVPSPASPSDVA